MLGSAPEGTAAADRPPLRILWGLALLFGEAAENARACAMGYPMDSLETRRGGPPNGPSSSFLLRFLFRCPPRMLRHHPRPLAHRCPRRAAAVVPTGPRTVSRRPSPPTGCAPQKDAMRGHMQKTAAADHFHWVLRYPQANGSGPSDQRRRRQQWYS